MELRRESQLTRTDAHSSFFGGGRQTFELSCEAEMDYIQLREIQFSTRAQRAKFLVSGAARAKVRQSH
jgi:hypothetical protein